MRRSKRNGVAQKAVQTLFYNARVPEGQLPQIMAALDLLKTQVSGVEKLKVRSSSNAEDIPNFDGAGLHDSFSAEFDKVDRPDFSCELNIEGTGVATKLKMKPKTVQCAINGVYASLWNPRAIEERSFARLDHATAAMGLAVVPAYDTEDDVAQNGVLITRVVNAGDLLGYLLSLQVGNNLVTNPTPGTLAETTFAVFGDVERATRFSLARHAIATAGQPPIATAVLPAEKMNELVEIGKAVEIA